MSPPGVALATLGCRLNQSEGFSILEQLKRRGFEHRAFSPGARVYIVNTCTVTGRSDYKSRQLIRRAISMVPNHGLVVVTGCYSQLHPQQVAGLGHVHLVTGNVEKPLLHELILAALNGELSLPHIQVASVMEQRCFEPMEVNHFFGHSRAFLKIQEGCNHRCAYCTVWRARGPARSAPASWLLRQVQAVASAGYREVVLTGINLGAYQCDGLDLEGLLRVLLADGGMERIRLSSIEPTEVTPGLIDLIAETSLSVPGICPHLHIPLQSGSDRVLSLMGRRYSSGEFQRLADLLFEKIPDLFLGVDVMVGFPTESRHDFDLTYAMLQGLPLGGMHIFSYSPRPGTPAASMEQVDPGEKKRRYQALQRLRQEKQDAFARGFMGREVEVLMEGRRDAKTGLHRGLATFYLPVLVKGEGSSLVKGRYSKVRVTGFERGMLLGIAC